MYCLGQMIAQFWGLMALRLTDAIILPLNHTDQAHSLSKYTATLKSLLDANSATDKVNVQPIQVAVKAYHLAAQVVEEETVKGYHAMDPMLARLNDRLAFTERRFRAREGLPGRKWFKHVLQAPGLYLGYGAGG